MSSTQTQLPPMTIVLQQRGFYHSPPQQYPIHPTTLKIHLQTSNATMPTKATADSAGYGMFSAENIAIVTNLQLLICTNIPMCQEKYPL